jgi:hydroxyacylglutathione hydrolase
MVFKQYYLGCLAHASYLIADEASGQAAVVDPQRDVEQYLEGAAALGCRISHVFLTHLHADFLAGHLELRERTGAVIHLGARAQAEYPFVAMADGDAACGWSCSRRRVTHPSRSRSWSMSVAIATRSRMQC